MGHDSIKNKTNDGPYVEYNIKVTMRIKYYITILFRFLIEANVIKTIIFNFRHMPFNVAIKLPVHLYGPIDLCNTIAGCVSFSSKLHFGGWKIGQWTGYPYGNEGRIFRRNRFVTRLCIEGKLLLGEYGIIGNGVVICIRRDGVVSIGSDLWLGHGTKIICKESITIGERARIGWESQIYDTNFHFLSDAEGNIHRKIKPIIIGDYVWIGNRTTITKGTRLGNYSIVSVNSLVNKDYGNEEHCIYGGIPAKRLKTGYSFIYNETHPKVIKWFAAHPDKEMCNISDIS